MAEYEVDIRADVEAELARDDDRALWTDARWTAWEEEQAAAAYVSACDRTERALSIGYGG